MVVGGGIRGGGADSGAEPGEEASCAFFDEDHAHALEDAGVEAFGMVFRRELALELESVRGGSAGAGAGVGLREREGRGCVGARARVSGGQNVTYRVLTVSNGCVTVTAPQAAIPPARKLPAVVDIALGWARDWEEVGELWLVVRQGIVGHGALGRGCCREECGGEERLW